MTDRMNALIGDHYTVQRFADLPVPYQLAIVVFMAVDGGAWTDVELPILTEDNQKEVLTGLLPTYIERYGNTVFGTVTLGTTDLQASVMRDPEIAESFETWSEYHDWYVSGGAPEHPQTDRWPVILSSDDFETIRDGWHRFHSYVLAGATEVPAVFFPTLEHITGGSAAA